MPGTACASGYDLIRVRENAESVAFFQGGTAEWSKFQALFDELLMPSCSPPQLAGVDGRGDKVVVAMRSSLLLLMLLLGFVPLSR